MESILQAGFCCQEIQPPLGLNIPGYYHARPAEGTADPLRMRAAAFACGDEKAVIFNVESIGIRAAAFEIIKKHIAKSCDISEDAIYINCVHSHTSFRILPVTEVEDLLDMFMLRLYMQFADVAKLAFQDLKPATILTASGEAKDIAFVRRYRMADGTVRTNPPVRDPNIVAPVDTPDEQVRMVRILREGAKEICMLHFGTHADTVGGHYFCPDWPGYLVQQFNAALENKVETILNVHLVRRNATVYSEAGHEEAMAQFSLVERGDLPKVEPKGNPILATSSLHEVMVGNDKVQATFDAATGRLTALAFDGRNIIADGQGFLYDNHRWIENDRFGNTSNGLEAEGTIEVTEKDGNTIIKTRRGGSLCDTEINYIIYPQGIVDVEATFVPKSGNLRRAGLVCMVDSSLHNVDYYAYGPWENYCDRKDGAIVGRYSTTVAEMPERYVKPQMTGGREGLRQLTLSDDKGFGITIETQGTVAFSAIPYTDADLMNAQHFWEMQARPYTVLHLDAWTRGVGNASCGHDVDTLPEYRVPNQKMTYTLRICKRSMSFR
jgi:hypothetical protein